MLEHRVSPLLVLGLALTGCSGTKADAAAQDRAAAEAAYGVSLDVLRAVPGVTVTVRPGVVVDKQHQVTVVAGGTDDRIALGPLLDRLAAQSPTNPFVIEGAPPVSTAELLAPCRALLTGADGKPCLLEVHTAGVRYQVEITGTPAHYAATFHALRA